MREMLQYLKLSGEQLDSQIAAGMGISLASVHTGLSELSAKGDLVTCRVIRFDDGEEIDGTLYRAAGYMPPPAPGRKSKAQITETQQISEHE
jgi:hypothetical protein